MFIYEYPLLLVPFVVILVITSYTDFRNHRIANIWTFGGCILALLLRLVLAGWDSSVSGAGGVLIGFLLFLPFYLAGGMAAGDVKLMAAVGAFLGSSMILPAVAFSLISGLVFAIAYIILRGDLKAFLLRYLNIIKLFAMTRNLGLSYMAPDDNEVAAQRFPYAIAITSGCCITLVLYWR